MKEIKCKFCQRKQAECTMLISSRPNHGHRIYICDRCVAICAMMVLEDTCRKED